MAGSLLFRQLYGRGGIGMPHPAENLDDDDDGFEYEAGLQVGEAERKELFRDNSVLCDALSHIGTLANALPDCAARSAILNEIAIIRQEMQRNYRHRGKPNGTIDG